MSDGIYPVFSSFDAPLNRMKNRAPDGCFDLNEMISTVRSERFKDVITDLRNMTPIVGEQEKAFSKRQQAFKLAKLPAFTPWGTFSSRARDSLVTPSWVACVDLDHIENPGDILRQLQQDSQLGLIAGFISPRGKGLKIFIAIEPAANINNRYIQVLHGVQKYLDVKYHLPWDRSVETPNQTCYLSYDPDAFLVENGKEITPFNPDPWVLSIPKVQYQHSPLDDEGRIKKLISEITKSGKDITGKYADWISIAFGIANTWGEGGLQYFIDISRNYPNFNEKEATKKYLSCCHSSNNGDAKKCTLATVYYYAIKNGIDLASTPATKKIDQTSPQIEHTAELRNCGIAENSALEILENAATAFGPCDDFFTNSVERRLPNLLRQLTALYDMPIQKDILAISSLISLSAVMPNVSGIYGDDRYSPHLFLYIVSEAGAWKGIMKQAYSLVNPTHKYIRAQSRNRKLEYEEELRQYEKRKEEGDTNIQKPMPPTDERLVVTANCSAAKFNLMIAENVNGLLMIETEGESLANTFQKEYGKYSETLRKAFHHEPIMSQFRNEDYEIDSPKLAVLLSGTPDQVTSLIHDPENGLFSRFLFYVPEIKREWVTRRPANKDGVTVNDKVVELGKNQVIPMYLGLLEKTLRFEMTEKQWDRHDAIFRPLLSKCTGNLSGMRASVLRLGLILFRFAMVLSVIRSWENGLQESEIILCRDEDFYTAEDIVRKCIHHTVYVLTTMKKKVVTAIPTHKALFYNKLPRGEEYDTTTWWAVADSLRIRRRTAERYHNDLITEGAISREQNGKFKIIK